MKKFWTEAVTEKTDGGWQVLLDERPVRTPAKRPCVVPVEAMAVTIAAEWNAQDDAIDPMSMPITRAASTCLDRVAPEMLAVQDNISGYGETDLLCYRALHPPKLVSRQSDAWDPWLRWSDEVLDAPLVTAKGVMHVQQPDQSLGRLAEVVAQCCPWTLTALSELVTISGSLVLGLAIQRGELSAEQAWPLSRIDEDWNIEKWGHDDDAAAHAERRRADFLTAGHLLNMLPSSAV